MCTVLLPPGVNPIAINKYINININTTSTDYGTADPMACGGVRGAMYEGVPQIHIILKCVMGSFGIHYILLTRQYTGSLLWRLGVIPVIIRDGSV
jgi:hypothetical protein